METRQPRPGARGSGIAAAQTVVAQWLPGPARDMGLDEPVRAVRRKVLAALPPGLRDASERAGQRFHLDAPGWFTDTDPPPLDLVRDEYPRRDELPLSHPPPLESSSP